MNTLHQRFLITAAIMLLLTSFTFAGSNADTDKILANEEKLVKNVELPEKEQEKEEVSFWDRMADIYKNNEPVQTDLEAELDPTKPLRDVGETEGFWTRIKKAFAYRPQPKKRDSKRDIEINVLMIEGREYFRDGNYHKSLQSFKEVVQRDPYNITARRYIKNCQESLNRITIDDFDIVKRERLQDVDKAWLIKPSREKEIESVTMKISGLTERIIDKDIQQIVPSVQFIDAKLPVVFEYLFNISDPKVSIVTDIDAMKKYWKILSQMIR